MIPTLAGAHCPSLSLRRVVECRQGSLNRRPKPARRPHQQRRPALATPSLTEPLHLNTKLAERRLADLLAKTAQLTDGGQLSKDVREEIASLLCTVIEQGRGGGEVEALLRSAMRVGAAGPGLVTAAFDRLRALHLGRRNALQKQTSPSISAAFDLAMEQGVAILEEATPELLLSMARTNAQLYHPAAAAAAAPQQAQRRQRQQAAATGAFVALVEAADPTKQSTAGDLCAFVSATFSCPGWHMGQEQRVALLRLVLAQRGGSTRDYSEVLTALTRLQRHAGAEAVAPFVEEGVVAAIVDRTLAQLDAPTCSVSAWGV